MSLNDNIDENKEVKTLSLKSQSNAEEVLNSISRGETVELNFNTFMLAEAYSQLPTILKLHELQTRCLDMYYKQVSELLDEEDANVFMLDKIITTINNSIDRCNNIILKLGLNTDISESLMIKHVDNSQSVNVYQSQISKQKVIDTVHEILKQVNIENVDTIDIND